MTTIYEIPPSQFGIAAPLFDAAWFDRAYIDAVFQGRQTGRIFVDHPERPTAALLARTYGYFIAGSPQAISLRRFILDAPAEAGVFADLFGYVPIGDAWTRTLIEDHGERLIAIRRRGFRWIDGSTEASAIVSWRERLPADATMQRMDADLVRRFNEKLGQGVIRFIWGEDEAFLAGGFGFCLLVGNEVGSVAFTAGVSAEDANIGVVTAPGYRRQGLAMLVCAAFIEHCLASGLTPTWDCDADNIASGELAQRLGFQECPSFTQLSPPSRTRLTLSHGLWKRVPGTATKPAIWRRL